MITNGAQGGFRYLGENSLPEPSTAGQFVVCDSGELYLGLNDGTWMMVGGTFFDTEPFEEVLNTLRGIVSGEIPIPGLEQLTWETDE